MSAVFTRPHCQPTDRMPQLTFHDLSVALFHFVPVLLKLLFQGLPDAFYSWRKGKEHLQQGCAFRQALPDIPLAAIHCLHGRRLMLFGVLLRGRRYLWQCSVASCRRHVLLNSEKTCHRPVVARSC